MGVERQMTRILAVDPSFTGTGLCWGAYPWRADRITTDARHPMARRISWIAQSIVLLCKEHDIELVAIEEPISHGAMNTTLLGGLGWSIRVALFEHGISYVDVGNSVRTKWATGNGNAKKVDVLLAASRILDYRGNDDNVADAMWIYDLANIAVNEHPDRFGLLADFRREVLGNLDWPQAAQWPKYKRGKNAKPAT